MKVYGYARVSTRSQKLDPQMKAIVKFCKDHNHTLEKIFTNISSGKNENDLHLGLGCIMENGFLNMMESLRSDPDGVKAIIVTDLGRISLNINTCMDYIQELNDLGVRVISIKNPGMFANPDVTKLLTSFILAVEELDNKYDNYLNKKAEQDEKGMMKVYGYAWANECYPFLGPQVEGIKKYCENQGHSLIKIFSDSTTCQYSYKRAFKEMMKTLRSNKDGVGAVVVTTHSELSPDISTFLRYFQELNAMGVSVLFVKKPQNFSDSAVTKFLLDTTQFIFGVEKEMGEVPKELPVPAFKPLYEKQAFAYMNGPESAIPDLMSRIDNFRKKREYSIGRCFVDIDGGDRNLQKMLKAIEELPESRRNVFVQSLDVLPKKALYKLSEMNAYIIDIEDLCPNDNVGGSSQ